MSSTNIVTNTKMHNPTPGTLLSHSPIFEWHRPQPINKALYIFHATYKKPRPKSYSVDLLLLKYKPRLNTLL